MHKGYREVDDVTLAAYLQGERLNELVQNEYVIFDDKAMRFDGKQLRELDIPKLSDNKFKPKNVLQQCAFDLMNNFNIPVKVLCGLAGSGKTKIGIRFAMGHLTTGKVDKVVIVRNNTYIGEDLGAFKGSKDDKVSNWMAPIFDVCPELKLHNFDKPLNIEFTVPGLLMGRDFQRTAILVDDAQLLTKEQTKMCGERVGEDGYIVFLGDYNSIQRKIQKE